MIKEDERERCPVGDTVSGVRLVPENWNPESHITEFLWVIVSL